MKKLGVLFVFTLLTSSAWAQQGVGKMVFYFFEAHSQTGGSLHAVININGQVKHLQGGYSAYYTPSGPPPGWEPSPVEIDIPGGVITNFSIYFEMITYSPSGNLIPSSQQWNPLPNQLPDFTKQSCLSMVAPGGGSVTNLGMTYAGTVLGAPYLSSGHQGDPIGNLCGSSFNISTKVAQFATVSEYGWEVATDFVNHPQTWVEFARTTTNSTDISAQIVASAANQTIASLYGKQLWIRVRPLAISSSCSMSGTGQLTNDNPGGLSMVTFTIPPPTHADFTATPACIGSVPWTGSISINNLHYDDGTTYNFSNGNLKFSLTRTDGFAGTDIDVSSLPATATGLSPGEFNIKVIAGDLTCNANMGNVIVPNIPAMTTPVLVASPITCIGGSNGQIRASVTQGSSNYTFNLYNNVNGQVVSSSGAVGTQSYTFTNLSAGSYYVAVTDGCNTTVTSSSLTLSDPDPASQITISTLTMTGVACPAAPNTGTIAVGVINGVPGYTYKLYDASFSPVNTITSNNPTVTFTGVPAGSYNVKVQSGSGCISSPESIDVVLATPVSGSVTTTNTLCNGSTTGSIKLTPSGGSGTYQYSINGGSTFQSSNTFNGLAGGVSNVYNPVIRDAANTACTWSGSAVTINEPPSLVVTNFSVVTPLTCFGGSNGALAISVTGGTPSAGYYTYTLFRNNDFKLTTDQQATAIFNTLDAADYRVRITDGNNCSVFSGTLNLPQPDQVVINTTLKMYDGGLHVSCAGATDGELTISTSGGVFPHLVMVNGVTKTVSNSADQVVFTGLNVGDQIIGVSYNGSCSASKTVTLLAPNPIAIIPTLKIYDSGGNISCIDAADGELTVQTSGGAYPHFITVNGVTKTINNAADHVVFTGLSPISYDITGVSYNGSCHFINTINVLAPGPLLILPALKTYVGGANVSCVGAADGQLTVQTSGGAYPHYITVDGVTKTINNNADQVVFTSLQAKTYTIAGVSGNGICSFSKSVTLSPPNSLSITTTLKTYVGGANVSCNGSADGELTIHTTGGAYPHSVTVNGVTLIINNVTEQAVFTGLSSISYDITLIDANGCSFIKPVTLTQPTTVTIDHIDLPVLYGGNHLPCHGDKNAEVGLFTQGGIFPHAVTVNGVTQSISTAGGNTYFGFLSAGTYTVRVQDANGCIQLGSFTLTEPDAITLNTSQTQIIKPQCFGENTGSLQIQATGGIKIDGTHYRYVLTHKNVPPDLPFVFNAVRELQGDIVVFENLIAGEYNVGVYDNFSCVYTTTINVLTKAQIGLTINATDITCKGDSNGSANITITGGATPYKLIWQDGLRAPIKSESVNEGVSATMDHVGEGIYYVRVSDASGCEFYNPSFTFEVEGPDAPLKLNAETSMVSCKGNNNGIVLLLATGGWQESSYRYGTDPTSLSVGNSFYEDLSPGTYHYFVKDSRACISTVDVTITEPDAMISDVLTKEMVSCKGLADGSFTLLVAGGTMPYEVSLDGGIAWQGKTSFSGLAANSYHANIRDARGCTSQQTVLITEPAVLSASIASQTNTLCKQNKGAVTATVTGGTQPYNLQWIDNNNAIISTSLTADKLVIGDYHLHVRDGNKCEAELSATIINANEMAFEVTGITDVRCYGEASGKASVSISNIQSPYSIVWDNGMSSAAVTNLLAGTHQVKLIDGNTCEATKTFTINTPTALGMIINDQVAPTCFGDCNGKLQVTATGGSAAYSYQWTSVGVTSLTLTNACAGDYPVKIKDSHGCELQKTLSLKTPDKISVDIDKVYTICEGQTATLDAGIWSTYNWSSANGFSSTNQSVSITKAGAYQLLVKDKNGCAGTSAFDVVYSSTLLKAEFLIAKEAYVGDTVVCVEISGPEPSNMVWDYDRTSILSISSAGAYKELIFTKAGEFVITLNVQLGSCQDHQSKKILVHERQDKPNPGGRVGYVESGIKEFTIYPNPSEGKFSSKIALYKITDVTVRLVTFNGNIIHTRTETGSDQYDLNFDITGTAAGVYWLVAEADGKLQTLRLSIY